MWQGLCPCHRQMPRPFGPRPPPGTPTPHRGVGGANGDPPTPTWWGQARGPTGPLPRSPGDRGEVPPRVNRPHPPKNYMKKFMKILTLLTILIFLPIMATSDAATRYEATAYSLRGRTASGEFVREGIIAADPKVLPIGTRVAIRGMGEYVVKDTGRLIKGKRIDIWMPSRRQALQFGRRKVYLTVLSMPKRKNGNIRKHKKANRPTDQEVQNPEGGAPQEEEAQR